MKMLILFKGKNVAFKMTSGPQNNPDLFFSLSLIAERCAGDKVEVKWRSSNVMTVNIEQIQAINLMPLYLPLSVPLSGVTFSRKDIQ